MDSHYGGEKMIFYNNQKTMLFSNKDFLVGSLCSHHSCEDLRLFVLVSSNYIYTRCTQSTCTV